VAVAREALTNARKHAAGAPVTLELRERDGELVLDVTNGRGRRVDALRSGGLGLPALAERATAAGGRLEAGPTGSGGWQTTLAVPRALTTVD